MELTKESIDLCAKVYNEMVSKAHIIWDILREIEPDRYEYFKYVESVGLEDVEQNGLVYVRGWDGYDPCGADIPASYFYDEEWLETAKVKAEERKQERLRLAEQKEKELAELREKRDRAEYERLKAKFGE